MSYIPRSVDLNGLLQERRELLERISVIDGLLRFLQVETEEKVEEAVADSGVPRLGLTQAAREILRQADGKAMHGTEILKRALAMGVKIGGENPKNTLFGTLRRTPKDFRNVGRNRWLLASGGEASHERPTAKEGARPKEQAFRQRSDREKCIDAIAAIGGDVRVGQIAEYLRREGTPVPDKSIRSYVGKAYRAGEIARVGDGLYSWLGQQKDSAPSEGGAP